MWACVIRAWPPPPQPTILFVLSVHCTSAALQLTPREEAGVLGLWAAYVVLSLWTKNVKCHSAASVSASVSEGRGIWCLNRCLWAQGHFCPEGATDLCDESVSSQTSLSSSCPANQFPCHCLGELCKGKHALATTHPQQPSHPQQHFTKWIPWNPRDDL